MSLITTLRDKAEALVLPTALADERRRAREEVIRSDGLAAYRELEGQAIRGGWDVQGPAMDPEWQRELDRIAPRDGTRSWLKLRWWAGHPWSPVERWVIYQMSEPAAIPEPVLSCLQGPDPRTLGMIVPGYGWKSRARVSREQWDLYRETGCYASTFWIIQGTQGGHRARFTHQQKVASSVMGGPENPPVPGSLPYAPFDQRVVRALHKLHEVDEWAAIMEFGSKRPDQLDKADEEAMKETRARLWDWLQEQCMPDAERLAYEMKKGGALDDLPRTKGSLDADIESAREDFITDD